MSPLLKTRPNQALSRIKPNQEILVLNSSFEPLNITKGRYAIKLLLKEKAELLHDGVIRLLYYIRVPLMKTRLTKPTKLAIYRRDGHKCQYCGSTRSLTLDHVIPRSRGGDDSWENLVTCCCACNVKKSNILLEQTGMKLRAKPRPPVNKIYNAVLHSGNESWLKYSFTG